MVLFSEPARKEGGRARCARERMAGRGLASVRDMGEVWQGDGVHNSAGRTWVQGGGRQLAWEKSLTGESPLCKATTLVASVRGDGPSCRCDGRPGPPNSTGPINGLGLVKANSVEVLGRFGGF